MAVSNSDHPRRRLGAIVDALFGEAFERERRRRRRIAWLLVAAAALVAAALLVIAPGRPGRTGDASAATGGQGLLSVTLPLTGDYQSLTSVGGRLIVSGGPDGSPIAAPNTLRLADGRAAGTCAAAVVDPDSLRLISARRGNCGNPALYGERVLPVSVLSQNSTGDIASVHIATADASARDGYRLSPGVVTYPDCSGCRGDWIYGDGALWIFSPEVSGFSHRAELVRVSQRTGRVTQRWSVPMLGGALLAVDTDGLWIAPSVEAGVPSSHPTPAERARYQTVYRVQAGMRRPEPVLDVGSTGAKWIVASGHTFWAETGSPAGRNSQHSYLWRFDGTSAAPAVRHERINDSGGCDQAYGFNMPISATSAGQIYCVPIGGSGAVVRISPSLRRASVIANAHWSRPVYEIPAVALGGSFYFLKAATVEYRAHGPAHATTSGVLYRTLPR